MYSPLTGLQQAFGASSEDDPLGLAIKARARDQHFANRMQGLEPAPTVLAGTGVPGSGWDAFFQALQEQGVDKLAGNTQPGQPLGVKHLPGEVSPEMVRNPGNIATNPYSAFNLNPYIPRNTRNIENARTVLDTTNRKKEKEQAIAGLQKAQPWSLG